MFQLGPSLVKWLVDRHNSFQYEGLSPVRARVYIILSGQRNQIENHGAFQSTHASVNWALVITRLLRVVVLLMPGLSFLYGFDNVKSVLSALISRHSNGAALLGWD